MTRYSVALTTTSQIVVPEVIRNPDDFYATPWAAGAIAKGTYVKANGFIYWTPNGGTATDDIDDVQVGQDPLTGDPVTESRNLNEHSHQQGILATGDGINWYKCGSESAKALLMYDNDNAVDIIIEYGASVASGSPVELNEQTYERWIETFGGIHAKSASSTATLIIELG